MELAPINSLWYCILSYFITYWAGHILLIPIKFPSKFQILKEFTKLSAGFFLIFTLYAIFKTNGITSCIGILILGVSLFVLLYKENRLQNFQWRHFLHEARLSIKYIILQLLVLLIVYLFLLYKCYDPLANQDYHIYGDLYNYARNIIFIDHTGVESIYADAFNNFAVNRSLYHYGELWYAAFYYKLFSLAAFQALYFIAFPHILLFLVSGAAALIEVLIEVKNRTIYVFSFTILFITGISFFIPKTTLFTKGEWYDSGLFIQPKFVFSGIGIMYAVILIYLKKYYYVVLIAMSMILANIALAPSFFMAFSLGVLLLFLFKKINTKDFFGLSALILSTVLFIAVYGYAIMILNEKNNSLPSLYNNSIEQTTLAAYLKTAINCFAGQFIKSILSLSVYLIALYCIVKRVLISSEFKKVLYFLLMLHICSILSYAIFHQTTVDAVQLWTFIYIPLSSVFCFLMMIFFLQDKNKIVVLPVLFFMAFSMHQSMLFERRHKIDTHFYKTIKSEYDGSNVVFFKAKETFTSVYSKNINQYAPIPYLLMTDKHYNPVCLSVFEIPLSSERILYDTEKVIIENSVFYRFVQLQKIKKQFVSIEQSQQDFIRRNKVKFAITYFDTPLPSFLQSKASFIAKDSTEGVSFYKIKEI